MEADVAPPGLIHSACRVLSHGWLAVGYKMSPLPKIAGLSGLAAPLSGRASPFRAETALFLSSSPRWRLSLRRGEDEVGY
jgi:hypothetical protein